MRLTIYTANCRGNAKNNIYPNKQIVDCQEAFLDAVALDHVCGEFRDCRRSVSNFICSDCDVMDCDNDHSDNPDDWVTPEDLEAELEEICYVIVPSRNNMKPKDGKAARPRFHVYFPHEPITDAEDCAALKKAIYNNFPFFDGNALDAARFIFGNNAEEIIWHEGELTIDCIMKTPKKVYRRDSETLLCRILQGVF